MVAETQVGEGREIGVEQVVDAGVVQVVGQHSKAVKVGRAGVGLAGGPSADGAGADRELAGNPSLRAAPAHDGADKSGGVGFDDNRGVGGHESLRWVIIGAAAGGGTARRCQLVYINA